MILKILSIFSFYGVLSSLFAQTYESKDVKETSIHWYVTRLLRYVSGKLLAYILIVCCVVFLLTVLIGQSGPSPLCIVFPIVLSYENLCHAQTKLVLVLLWNFSLTGVIVLPWIYKKIQIEIKALFAAIADISTPSFGYVLQTHFFCTLYISSSGQRVLTWDGEDICSFKMATVLVFSSYMKCGSQVHGNQARPTTIVKTSETMVFGTTASDTTPVAYTMFVTKIAGPSIAPGEEKILHQ